MRQQTTLHTLSWRKMHLTSSRGCCCIMYSNLRSAFANRSGVKGWLPLWNVHSLTSFESSLISLFWSIFLERSASSLDHISSSSVRLPEMFLSRSTRVCAVWLDCLCLSFVSMASNDAISSSMMHYVAIYCVPRKRSCCILQSIVKVSANARRKLLQSVTVLVSRRDH